MNIKKTSHLNASSTSTSNTMDENALGRLLIKEAEVLSREKCLPLSMIIQCLEKAFQKVVSHLYGGKSDISVYIDTENQQIQVYQTQPSFEETESDDVEIQYLPIPHFTRIAVQN